MRTFLFAALGILSVSLVVYALGERVQPEFVVTNHIKIVAGTYEPLNVQIKRGQALSFEVLDPPGSEVEYGIQNIKGSSERYSSNVLRPGDRFNLIFERAGTFKWQDRYNQSIVGTVRVVE